jgi:hypothetical protein
MRAKTEEVLAKLRELKPDIKSVDFYAGQLDEADKYITRLPGILLFFRDNPHEKSDYDYSTDIFFSAYILHSNLQNPEIQFLETLDYVDMIKAKLKELKRIKITNVAPAESSKILTAFDIQFNYVESK